MFLFLLGCPEPSTPPPSDSPGPDSELLDSEAPDSEEAEPDWADFQLRNAEATVYGDHYAGLSADRDGDGTADLITVSPHGRLQVWTGPFEGEVEREPEATSGQDWCTPLGISSTMELLDADGDGRQDLLVGAPLYGGQAHGSVRLLLADDSLLGEEALSLYGASNHDYLGFSVSSAGDQDGDGLPDLLLGAFDEAGFYLVPSGARGSEGVEDAALAHVHQGGWAPADVAAMDLDQDGLSELLVAAGEGLWAFPHGLEGEHDRGAAEASWTEDGSGTWVVEPSEGGLWIGGYFSGRVLWLDPELGEIGRLDGEPGLGFSVEPVGDLDGDGVQELGIEQADVLYEGVSRWWLVPDQEIVGVHAIEDLGRELELPEGGAVWDWTPAGDPDGDGLDEVWVFGSSIATDPATRRLGL